jgi:predicted secreted protein
MTTAAITGQALSLSIGNDVVAGSTAFSISFNQATVDVTSKDDAFQAAFLPGRRDWTIDVDAIYVYTDVAKKILMTAVNAGTLQPITCVFSFASPDTATYTGSCIVTSFALAMPSEDAVTFTCSLQGTGALTISAS